jgi:hypothetical protein
VTTDKTRVTIYLANYWELDELHDTLRRLAPLDERGAISRSTAVEAAVSLALADLRTRGRLSAIYEKLVTSPAESETQL